jgi:hypothetical protein
MKIALIIFFAIVGICILYAPILMSGRMSEWERRREKEEKKDD